MNSKIDSVGLHLMKIKSVKRLEFFEQIFYTSEQDYLQDLIKHTRTAIDSITSQANQFKNDLVQAEKLNQHLTNGINIFQQAICEIEKMVSNVEESDQDFEEIKKLISIRNEVYIKENHEMELVLQDLDDVEKNITKMKEIWQLQQENLNKISQKYDQDTLISNFIERKTDELSKMVQMKMKEEKQWQSECEQKKNDIDQIKKNLEIYQPKLDQFILMLEKLTSDTRQVNGLIDKKLSKLNKELKALQIQTINQVLKEVKNHKISIYEMKSEELKREEEKKERAKEADHKIEFEKFQAMKDTSALLAWKEINEENLLAEKISHSTSELKSLQIESEKKDEELSELKQNLTNSESSKREEMRKKQDELNVLQQSILIIEEEMNKLKNEIDQVKRDGESLSEKLKLLNERWAAKQKHEIQIAKILRKK